MRAGEAVRRFEEAFAEHVGARYCIALANGTATLHTALVAMGVKPGDRVAVPPLTMSATTIAVLQAGAVPVFEDVDPAHWLMAFDTSEARLEGGCYVLEGAAVPVSLYGFHCDLGGDGVVVDAAQTLQPHGPKGEAPAFTSYSFQASKILSLGEGGMLATNNEELARRAREFSSLGYRMRADQPRIDPATLKHPTFARHHVYPAWNYRMSDVVAERGLANMEGGYLWDGRQRLYAPEPDELIDWRRQCAALYREAVRGCPWITPQHVPEGWEHDYWTYAVALESAELWEPFVAAIERHGGGRPYAAWRLTYQEPAFRHLAPDGTCPVAEDLQPRLVQAQTNDLASAQRNAEAWSKAIKEVGG